MWPLLYYAAFFGGEASAWLLYDMAYIFGEKYNAGADRNILGMAR